MSRGDLVQPGGREDTAAWTGEGDLTSRVLDALRAVDEVRFIRVENAPSTRSDADYNFISNEIFVAFREEPRRETVHVLGLIPITRRRRQKVGTMAMLEARLTAAPDVGAPDYSDEGMIQYLRTERIIPPYQTRGYKIVELLRIYEVGSARRK